MPEEDNKKHEEETVIAKIEYKPTTEGLMQMASDYMKNAMETLKKADEPPPKMNLMLTPFKKPKIKDYIYKVKLKNVKEEKLHKLFKKLRADYYIRSINWTKNYLCISIRKPKQVQK